MSQNIYLYNIYSVFNLNLLYMKYLLTPFRIFKYNTFLLFSNIIKSKYMKF